PGYRPRPSDTPTIGPIPFHTESPRPSPQRQPRNHVVLVGKCASCVLRPKWRELTILPQIAQVFVCINTFPNFLAQAVKLVPIRARDVRASMPGKRGIYRATQRMHHDPTSLAAVFRIRLGQPGLTYAFCRCQSSDDIQAVSWRVRG